MAYITTENFSTFCQHADHTPKTGGFHQSMQIRPGLILFEFSWSRISTNFLSLYDYVNKFKLEAGIEQFSSELSYKSVLYGYILWQNTVQFARGGNRLTLIKTTIALICGRAVSFPVAVLNYLNKYNILHCVDHSLFRTSIYCHNHRQL